MTTCPHCGYTEPTPPARTNGRPREAPRGQRAYYFAFTPHGWRRCNADFVNPDGIVGKVFAASLSGAKDKMREELYQIHAISA